MRVLIGDLGLFDTAGIRTGDHLHFSVDGLAIELCEATATIW